MKNQMISAVLAAGESSRFGCCKQTALVSGIPMLKKTISALPSKLKEVIVITGAFENEVSRLAISAGARCINNPNYQSGIGTSIKVAAQYAINQKSDLLLTLGDLPFVTADDYLNLMKQYNGDIIFSSFQSEIGPPAIFSLEILPKLMEMGDADGAKSIFQHPNTLAIENAFLDIDIPEDLNRKG